MKIEPSALHRQGARELRQLYVAYINEGFTTDQALELCKTVLMTAGNMGTESEE